MMLYASENDFGEIAKEPEDKKHIASNECANHHQIIKSPNYQIIKAPDHIHSLPMDGIFQFFLWLARSRGIPRVF